MSPPVLLSKRVHLNGILLSSDNVQRLVQSYHPRTPGVCNPENASCLSIMVWPCRAFHPRLAACVERVGHTASGTLGRVSLRDLGDTTSGTPGLVILRDL